MKKKIGLLLALLFGLCVFSGTGKSSYAALYAEPDESSEPAPAPEESSEPVPEPEESSEPEAAPVEEEPKEAEPEVFECKVILNILAHGEVKVDKTEGHVGDIVIVTANPDLFYIIDYAEVNGSALIEDEETKGLYKFALVEGDNRVTIRFIVDKELLGEMSTMYEQASNKDWTNLFSLKNVVSIVSTLLSGGLLIAMATYFIRDKKIAKNVKESVSTAVSRVIPETTKQVVIEQTENVFKPIFEKTAGYQTEIIRVLGVLIKCIALMQEDTPDSKRAILAELANLNIGDMKVIEDAKSFIDNYFAEKMTALNDVMNSLDHIIDKNKELTEKENALEEKVASEEESPWIPSDDNGTQI